MSDNKISTSEATPRLGFVAMLPATGFARQEDQSGNRILVGVGTCVQLEVTHDEFELYV